MTGALIALLTVALATAAAVVVRRRRRDPVPHSLAMASPGGRALAANLGILSDLRLGADLRLPRPRK
jgi:hypothetical protein